MENHYDNATNPDSVPFIVYEHEIMRRERNNKRFWIAFIVIIVVIALLIGGIVGGFLWYLNQYDVVSNEEVTVDGTDGVANYVGRDGAIYNGENSHQKDADSTEEERAF